MICKLNINTKQEQEKSSPTAERQFQKKQCKAKKRQASPVDSAEGIEVEEATKPVKSDRKVSFNLDLVSLIWFY